MSEEHRNYRERRIQTRYPVDLHAKVRGRNQSPTNCRVRNICNGGVLLEAGGGAPELPFQPNEHVDLYFDLPDAQSMDPVQAVIEVVHRVDQGVGARFIRLVGDGRARLVRFISEAAAAHRGDADEELDPSRARARDILQDVGRKHLGGLLDSLLETLVEELWRHSEHAGSDSERTRFTGEIGMLARAIQDESVPNRLLEELLEALRKLGTGAPGESSESPETSADSTEELQLVDQDEFEIWLAKSQLANRLEQELHEPLDSLRNQVAALFQGTFLPMEPLALADAIEQILRDIGVGLQLQRLSMEIVANHLSRNLGSFYREVLWAWSKAGLSAFEPGADGSVAAAPAPSADATGPEVQAGTSDSMLPSEPTEAVPTPDPGVSGAAPQAATGRPSRARAAQTGAQTPAHPEKGPASLAQKREARLFAGWRRIADLLASLPADHQVPEPDANRPLKEVVAQWLATAEAKNHHPDRQPVMSPQVEERVELTDRLLAHMLADPSTPQRLRSLIKPLTTRFLSMAVTGPEAVADANRPLVNLMNRLEHLLLFLLNEEGDDLGLQAAVERVIDKLVSSDNRDLETLTGLSQQLGDLETRAGREYQGNVSSWVDVCESRERARLAREQVRQRLNTAFSGKRIHKVVDELLESGWRSLLESVCAGVGTEGPRWRKAWQRLMALHRMTAGQEASDTERESDLDSLIADLRESLTYIGTDPIVCDELLRRIETAVRRVRASMDREDDYLLFCPLAPEPDSEPDQVPPGLPTADWEKGLEQVDALPLGALIWMRLKDAKKALRLIWRNEDGSRLAVTDTMGKRMKVLRRYRLAEAFARGQARAQKPTAKRMVTRAADAALSDMQQGLSYHEAHDPLTGLSTQRHLVGSLTQLLVKEADSRNRHALCLLELDRYDTLTGAYGYKVGDRMLREVARLLEGVMSDALCMAYLGGSRFGLLTSIMDRDHATEIGESIRAGLTSMPFDLQGKPFRVTGSLGIAILTDDTRSPDKLLSGASVACLAAQREGGDRVIVFSKDNEIIARQVDHMRGWAQAEDVLQKGRRRLRYQRIVPLDTTAELSPHCEILLSVYDEDGVPLSLQSFIAAAEAFNMMREVDRQVIDEVFEWIYAHPEKVRSVGGIAINLSGQSLGDPGLVGYIRRGLDRFRIPVEMVSFEVTETAAIVNLDQAANMLEGIKALGCRIALDDFGAGMSSYSYLKNLPVDFVKIDGSFVKDILVSPDDRQIVKSFNEIAHFMGKKTIAEYVENQEIMELLRDIGVDYAQGYAIEKPQFIDEMN